MAVYSGESVDLAIDPLLTCKICISNYYIRDMYELSNCKCLFCITCIKEYLRISIMEGHCDKLTCADACCPKSGHFTEIEIEKLVTKSLYDRYCRLRYEREVDQDPRRTWCPKPGCETVCEVSEEERQQKLAVSCPKCRAEFCLVCKNNWHGTTSCDSNMGTGRNGGISFRLPFKSDGNAVIKRCPECHVPIERTDGCAQMMCKNCSHIFCWYCLASLEDDLLLRHYDSGPCKDKLGHSRASVIGHRAQVVVLCVGFGILLILTSPILLIAAPCVFCCKRATDKNTESQEDVATIS